MKSICCLTQISIIVINNKKNKTKKRLTLTSIKIGVSSRSKQGFTLIELLVVIAIIGILSSVVLTSLSSARDKAIAARKISDLRQIETALQFYFHDHGVFPASAHTCNLKDWPASFKTALQPYLDPVPIDPRNEDASCVSGNWNNYYSFYNPITWTWSSCGPGTIVLSSIGGGIKAVREDCYPSLGTSNRIILKLD